MPPSQFNLLIVDNAATMRSALAHQLELFGFGKVLQARDNLHALQLLQTEEVHLVLSELTEPTNGLALLSAMRENAPTSTTPFMFMLGELDRASALQAIELGTSDLLIKPFTTKKLIDRLLNVLKRNNPAADLTTDAPPPPAPGAERTTILVVDDTPENLQLLAGLFRDRYKVKLASNGEKALAICQSDAPPDLILLDVMMPGMDGFEVARRVREQHASSHTPIIFVTAMADDASRRTGLSLGAIDYVAKPVEPDLLQLRVNNLMQYVQHRQQMQTDFDRLREIAALREEVTQLRAHLDTASASA